MTEKRKIKIDIFQDNKKILSENEKVEVIAVSYDHSMASCARIKIVPLSNRKEVFYICGSNLKF